MTTALQLRRGTTAQHSTFTGAAGEVTVDTTKNVVVVHDGVTQGGTPLAKEADAANRVRFDTASQGLNSTQQANARANIGLGNVNNTSDADKPISTAVQAALNAKQATLVSGTNIKTVNGQSLLGSGNININLTVPDGTTSQKGIVQLTTSVSSTSTTLAATASAVKAAYDLAASKLSSLLPSSKGIGDVVVAWNSSTTSVAAGSTIAGSSLYYLSGDSNGTPFDVLSSGTSAFPSGGKTALSGTWRAATRCKGRHSVTVESTTYYWYPSIFVRIS